MREFHRAVQFNCNNFTADACDPFELRFLTIDLSAQIRLVFLMGNKTRIQTVRETKFRYGQYKKKLPWLTEARVAPIVFYYSQHYSELSLVSKEFYACPLT